METFLFYAMLVVGALNGLAAWYYRRRFRRRDAELLVLFEELWHTRREMHAANSTLRYVGSVAEHRGLEADPGMCRTLEEIRRAVWVPQK